MRKREKFIGLWLSDTEYKHLLKQCALSGLNTSTLLRHSIMDVDIQPKPPDTYAALLQELSAIGNNVNQIAYWANAIPHKGHWKSGDSGRRRISTAGVALGEGYAVTVRPQ